MITDDDEVGAEVDEEVLLGGVGSKSGVDDTLAEVGVGVNVGVGAPTPISSVTVGANHRYSTHLL